MMEIWKMWHMVRIAKKYEVTLTTQNVRLETIQKLTKEHGNSPNFSTIIDEDVIYNIHNHEPLIRKRGIINLYVNNYKTKLENINFTSPSEKEIEIISEANILFNNCVKSDFFHESDKDKEFIYITPKGKQFSDSSRVGLLNEWFKALGTTRFVILWILSFLIANYHIVWSIIKNIKILP